MVKFFCYVRHFFEVDFNFFSDNHNWKDFWLKEKQARKKYQFNWLACFSHET